MKLSAIIQVTRTRGKKKKKVVFNTTVTPRQLHNQSCTWPQQSSSRKVYACYQEYHIFKILRCYCLQQNIKTVAGVPSLDFGDFGHKHSDVGFVYLEDHFSHTQNSPHLESQVITSNFEAMLPSRTEHKLTSEYGTSRHGFCHCNSGVTWQNNRIGQWPFFLLLLLMLVT